MYQIALSATGFFSSGLSLSVSRCLKMPYLDTSGEGEDYHPSKATSPGRRPWSAEGRPADVF